MKHIDLSRVTNDEQCERRAIVDESEQTCYMVQGNDSLEVHLDTHLDDNAISSNDVHYSMDAHK